MRILLVEDDPLIVEFAQEVVGSAGHELVGIAATKAAAIQLAADTHPDLALMDFRLADGATGADTAFELREGFGIPSLFVSGNADLRHEHIVAAGALGWLRKPYNVDDLERALAAVEARLRGEAIDLPQILQP